MPTSAAIPKTNRLKYGRACLSPQDCPKRLTRSRWKRLRRRLIGRISLHPNPQKRCLRIWVSDEADRLIREGCTCNVIARLRC